MTTGWLAGCGVCATILVMAATGALCGQAPESAQQTEEQPSSKETTPQNKAPQETDGPQETGSLSPVDELRRAVDEAMQFYRARDYEQAAQRVVAARRRLAEFKEASQSSEAKRRLAPWSGRLSNLARKLVEKGVAMPDEADSAGPDDEAPVSFVRDVVPVLLRRCGACHVRKTSGELSLASYADIARGGESGPVVIPGNAAESRLVDVLTSGEMPAKGSIDPEQIDIIARWVASGAKFDGDDPATSIVTLLGSKPMPEGAAMESVVPLVVNLPTGNETISFVRDLAPVFREQCGGCHGRERSSADLRLDTFENLLGGSESGSIITPGDADANANGDTSLLVRKLRGEAGAQMPLDRPPLANETIDKFATWINEGAAFDGGDTSATMRQLIETSERANLSHVELATRRRENAHADWRLAVPDAPVQEIQLDDLLALGTVSAVDLEIVAKLAAGELERSRRQLSLPTDGPGFHGRLTLFAFDRPFDYGEFGLMVESRDIPFADRAHWRVQGLDAYVCVTLPATINPDDQDLQARLCQQVAGALLADIKGLPEWFVAGSAREIAAQLHPKSSLAATWRTEVQQHVAELTRPTDLVDQVISADATAALGQGLVGYMMAGTPRYTRLIGLVSAQGQTFDEALKDAFGRSPEELATMWAESAGRRRR